MYTLRRLLKYTQLQKSPLVACYSQRMRMEDEGCPRFVAPLFPSTKATPPFLTSSLFVTLFCRPWCQLLFPNCPVFSHWFFSALMWAQILRAGPSLMFMLVMRWSSVSSSSAWPSISCTRNASATSLQPEHKQHRGRSYPTAGHVSPLQWITRFCF